jgi:biopolymer transport protein ExbB
MKAFASNRTALLGAVVGLLVLPGTAQGWWNSDWAARKPFRIDTSAAGANVTEPIGAVPILIRLHPGNFRLDAAKEDGSDLRFIAGDDKTPLKHHIEKYDALLGEALVWVQIPDLKPGAKTEFWLYYKNPKAVPAEDAKGTYDPDTALVYHFAERNQPPRDATVWANQALDAGFATDTLIGSGLRLDGTRVVGIPAGASLAWPAGGKMTWSAWVKPSEKDSTGVVFSRRDGRNALVIGLDSGRPYVEVTGTSGADRTSGGAAIPAGGWHHVAVTVGDGVVLYVDGSPVARLAAALPALGTVSSLGGDKGPEQVADPVRPGARPPAPPATIPGFKGELDELQISKNARPPGFIQVSAISQGTDATKLVASGQDEEGSTWSSGYFAIILKSVTLDGWVIIALLAVMSFISILVMLGKASQLRAVEKGDRVFHERFEKLGSFAQAVETEAPLGDDKELLKSPLYRLFLIGVAEIQKRRRVRRHLSAEAIEAIHATLTSGLVREGQALSKRLVLLTIAISGGPFLGLLGTVVGVMITFASIAAAGDVNVNAIAPGIAAALVATVAGLAVAIPALFAYNWLLTRVKEVTATMQIFVDELVTDMAETYAEGAEPEERGPRALAAAE